MRLANGWQLPAVLREPHQRIFTAKLRAMRGTHPIDPRSSKLVEDLFEELLPNFSSPYVNVNMDEPFGLGRGQSAGRGKPEELYLQFARRIFAVTC